MSPEAGPPDGELLLPYDPTTGLVLRGLFAGRVVGVVAAEYRSGHFHKGRATSVERVTLRPWWRWWRQTSALRLQVWPPE